MKGYLQFIIFSLLGLVIFSGCATDRHVTPSIQTETRRGLDLSPALIGSVFDGRLNQEERDAAKKLQSDLNRIYGSSIEWGDYFAKIPPGRVAIRIRIVTLGASFGSRLVSAAALANAVGSARVNATGPWGPVVGNVSSEQSVIVGSFSGEGWWNGAAWVDLEVEDLRGPNPISFILPIVAEHREPNIWGYTSGDRAAQISWNRVATQLTRALDVIVRTIRDQQQ
jgi:hypothetical protein